MKQFDESVKRGIVSLGMVASIILLASCSPKLEDQLAGKWQEDGGTETMEIFKDGAVTVMDEGMTMNGRYEIVAENRIKVELSGQGALAGPMVSEGVFSSHGLTFTMPDGSVHHYRKFQ